MLAAQGNYWGTKKDIGPNRSSKGTPQIDIVFEITHIAGNGEWNPIATFNRTVRIYLSDKAWEQSVKKLESLQFNGDFDHPDITSDGLELTCEHETYNGKQQERWELVSWSGSKERTPPDKATLMKLNARYKVATAASKVPASKPSAPPTRADDPLADYDDDGSGTPPSDDDIPF